VQTTIATKVAESNLANGTSYALTISDSAARRAAISTIQSQLSRKDLETAAKWVTGLPDDLQGTAVSGLAASWLTVDSVRALEWARGLPKGAAHDYAIGGVVSSIRSSNQAGALELSREIENPNIRDGFFPQPKKR
jgi:hypothetical protein